MSLALSEFFKRIGLSRSLGQMAVGMILAIPVIKHILFVENNLSVFNSLAEFGIIFLLLLTGMELNINKLKSASKPALIITLSTAMLSFAGGYFATVLMGFHQILGVVVGMCFAITAEDMVVKLLMEYDKLNSRVGSILIGASIVDDIFEIIFLSFIIVIAHQGGMEAIKVFPLKLVFFIGFCFFVIKTLPILIKGIVKEKSEITDFTISIILGLFIAIISSQLGFGTVLGALIGGLIIQQMITDKHEEHKVVKDLQLISFGFIVPFFFINIGMNLDVTVLWTSLPLVLVLFVAAIAPKIIGSLITKPFTGLRWNQLLLIGWAMNSRGGVGLVLAQIALAGSIISGQLYSAVILVVILTTFILPFIFKHYVKKYPDIMD